MENKNQEEEVVEEEEVEETNEGETTEEDSTDWKAKYEQSLGRIKRAETKAEKVLEKKSESKPSKSNDVDYGLETYLESKGATSDEEKTFIKEQLAKSGEKNLVELFKNEYFLPRLEKFRALDKTSEATIKGGGRSASTAVDNVDYWVGKKMEDVPDNMRRQVVNAKLAKDKDKGKFYNSKN